MLGVVGLAGADGFQVPGGYPTPYFTGGNLCVLQHQGTGGNDGALTDLAVVEQGAAHADECAVVDGAGMDGDVVADGDVIADVGGPRVVGDVNTRAVLNVGAVAYGDGGDVASYYGVEPDGAFVAHGYVADDGSIFAEIAVSTPLGRQTAVTLDECHVMCEGFEGLTYWW